MKPEFTKELRERFNAQYINTDAYFISPLDEKSESWSSISNFTVLALITPFLRSVNNITDREAITLAKTASGYTGRILIKERLKHGIIFDLPYIGKQLLFRYKYLVFHSKVDDQVAFQDKPSYVHSQSKVYDYLRSIGVAISFMDHSVEELVEAGWIKLVTEEVAQS